MSGIFNCNDDVIDILLNLLDIRSICCLDTVISNRVERKKWLECLRKSTSPACDNYAHCHSSIIWLSQKGLQAQHLKISDTKKHEIQSATFENFKVPTMQSIDLSNCRNLNDDGIKSLVNGCPHLNTAKLSGCYSITNDGILALAEGCNRHLHTVDISYSRNINSDGLNKLGLSCPNLTSIDFSHMGVFNHRNLVNDIYHNVSTFLKYCPKLQNINAAHCGELVSNEFLLEVAEHCPDLYSVV